LYGGFGYCSPGKRHCDAELATSMFTKHPESSAMIEYDSAIINWKRFPWYKRLFLKKPIPPPGWREM
ncbi:MAG: hypothetical protein ABSG67_18455, partial [Thermoguttaceae bacterium]